MKCYICGCKSLFSVDRHGYMHNLLECDLACGHGEDGRDLIGVLFLSAVPRELI